MKVTLVACGSRGDVQPMLALALGLERAGHQVVLTVPPDFAAWAGGYCPSVRSLGPGFKDNPEMRDAGLRSFSRFVKRELEAEIRDLPAIARGCDLVLAEGLAFGAHSVAERLGVPYRFITFAPLAMMGTDKDPLSSRAAYQLVRALGNFTLRRPLNRGRRALGLPPVDDVVAAWAGERPINATDAALTRLPEGAVPKSVQTAYMHLRQCGTLGDAVEAFLEDGPPPVYVGFGSVPIADPRRLGRMLAEVARSLGQRLVVLANGFAPDELGSDPRCLAVHGVPLEQLLPRVALAVHHGGAGTVATAARAGIPQLVAPAMADQFQWKSQVTRIGLGPSLPPFRMLSARTLGRAIAECLSNPRYAATARAVARQLDDADGVALTVALIEREYGSSGAGAARALRAPSGSP